MSWLGWIVLAVAVAPWLALVTVYLIAVRRFRRRHDRLWIYVRVSELVLFAALLAASVLTTRWLLIAEVLPLGILPFVRRQIGKRILAADRQPLGASDAHSY